MRGPRGARLLVHAEGCGRPAALRQPRRVNGQQVSYSGMAFVVAVFVSMTLAP